MSLISPGLRLDKGALLMLLGVSWGGREVGVWNKTTVKCSYHTIYGMSIHKKNSV